MRLKRKFFAREAKKVARDILGKVLVRQFPDGTKKEGVIVESEAYVGVEDKASHAYGGKKTKRTSTMFSIAGTIYVYFTYGKYWMLNIVTGQVGDPQAVLIRGLDNVSGPGRLTRHLDIDGRLNGEDVVFSNKLWVEDRGHNVPDDEVKTTPRIGVSYAQEWKDKLLRFVWEKSSQKSSREER